MPRLRYIEESEQTAHTRELIESARRTDAPDRRVVSLMTRSQLGIARVEYWNKLLCFPKIPSGLESHRRVESSHDRGRCSRSYIRSQCSSSTSSSRRAGLKRRTCSFAINSASP